MSPTARAETAPHPSVEKYARHVNAPFIRLLGVLGYGRVFTKAVGVRLWDHQGRAYTDLLAGFGAVNVGHNHPRLIRRVREFLEESAPSLLHVGPSPHAAELAEVLARLLPDPLEVSLFSSSGSEAVEAGMKLARAATGRAGFIYCRGGFHGTNLGSLSVMGEERMRLPFEPLLRGCTRVPFGDIEALAEALKSTQAAGFLVEPVQVEGGVVFPPKGYLRRAQELCREHGTLLILDEVQTGLGRTGRMFAFEGEGFTPDVLVLGKSLGGSLTPVSATLVSSALHKKAYGSMDRFDLHSSTFGGNTLSCVAAIETLKIIREDDLVEKSSSVGGGLLASLRRRLSGHPLVRDVRGRGLLIGIELGPTDSGWVNKAAPGLVKAVAEGIFGHWASLRLLEKGFVCQPASSARNVLRIEPPLTLDREEAERAAAAVEEVLSEYRGLLPLANDVTRRLGRQCFNGWKF